jgi:hypothetical protein
MLQYVVQALKYQVIHQSGRQLNCCLTWRITKIQHIYISGTNELL